MSLAEVKMINQENMGESLQILETFPAGFIDDHGTCDPPGAGGLDGHAFDVFEGGMD
jgi:hypothetical protein